MATAAWIAALVTAACFVLLLKLTVRLVGRKALDNGWDNALAYTVATTALALAVRWVIGTRSWLLIGLSPMFLWIGQTIALKLIYEIKTKTAVLIGITHTAVTTTVLSGLTMAAGVVAAYLLYGKIISDPMFLIRLILRLIGIWEGPLEVP